MSSFNYRMDPDVRGLRGQYYDSLKPVPEQAGSTGYGEGGYGSCAYGGA